MLLQEGKNSDRSPPQRSFQNLPEGVKKFSGCLAMDAQWWSACGRRAAACVDSSARTAHSQADGRSFCSSSEERNIEILEFLCDPVH